LLLALHASIKRAPYRRDFILRHVSDLDNLINSGFDWSALIERAKHCRVLPHLYFLIGLYRLFIDAKIPVIVVETIESGLSAPEKSLTLLHLSCVKGLRGKSYGRAFLYKLFLPFVLPSTRAAKLKSVFVAPLLFPESWRLAEIYGLPPTSICRFPLYVLEPFRWVILMLKKSGR
jgi:hypothetical protein